MESETLAFEDCLDALIDYRGKTPKKTAVGIPLVTAKIVKSGRIEKPDEFIAESDYESWMTRGYPELGDIVLTTEAPLGEVGQITFLPVALAQRIVTLRGKKDVLDNDYLLYLLQTEQMRSQLAGRATGTTVTGIKQSELRKVEVQLPSIVKQKEIASVLKALDHRIDNLRQTNGTLEAIAQALFKSWFVGFDGVPAGDMQESELGAIPKGWRAGSLRDVCAVHDSKRVPLSGAERAKRKGEVPYYGAAGVMDFIDNHLFDGTYVLVGEDGSVQTKDGYALTQYVWGKFWVNNHAHVLEGKNGYSTEQLLLALQRVQIGKYITGAVQPKLSQGNMLRIPVVLPTEAVVSRFAEVIRPIFESIKCSTEQATSLAALRDTLLPRLISGRIRIGDADEVAEGAAA